MQGKSAAIGPYLINEDHRKRDKMLGRRAFKLDVLAICGTTQAASYHHRHHHYWHHGYPTASYWNYYRVDWPGRGNDEESTR
jgi:hypothetical protein